MSDKSAKVVDALIETVLQFAVHPSIELLSGARTDMLDYIAALEKRLSDYDVSYVAVLEEKCAGDELHCACVPHLRQRIAELEAERDQLRAELDGADGAGQELMAENEALRAKVKHLEAERAATQDAPVEVCEWIPASQIPEIGFTGICQVAGNGYVIAYYSPYNTNDGRDWVSDEYGYCKVTHYMPLPEPPADGG